MSEASFVHAGEGELTYEQHIRPIFRAHCFDCHGATEKLRGGLDLRLVRLIRKGGDSGVALEVGKPEKSYLVERIQNGEMPPGDKRMSTEEVATIRLWIEQGAKTARPEPKSIGPGLGITPEERSFWAFQPIRRPALPYPLARSERDRVRTPIDALILQKMPEGAGFSPDADRRTLVRRVYFDLIGLPPTPEEMRRWLAVGGEDWYTRLLDEVMASPHYGERWGRHWLDVAGYSDSEGYTTSDAERPWAWKYRDWVVRALNADVPFDRFVAEQLAGDELAGPLKGEPTARQIELLTATGFLRMAADGTGSGANNADARNQVMTDTLKIVGSSLLGMSVHCAQCHDHRYDPIPQTDYYALRAVFEPALDWKAWKVPSQRRVSLYTAADRKKAADIEAEAKKIGAEKAKKQAEYMKQALEKELTKFPEALRPKLRDAYNAPGNKRTPEQKALLAKHPSVNISPGVLYQYLPKAADDLKKYDARMKAARAKKPVEEFVRVLIEPANHAPTTKLFHRGDHKQPKQTVAPGPLSVTIPEGSERKFPTNSAEMPTTGRRLAFGKWLAAEDNPLFARVIVNRVWMHHFGTGLVSTPGEFGKLGTKPTHPELLDWLADEFRRGCWSLKRLNRLILRSTVWRQSSEGGAGAFQRKKLVRLEAEILRDRMLAASGRLERKLYGKPTPIKENFQGQVVVNGEQTRRSLYIQVRRSRPVAMLRAFDAPVMLTNCENRTNSTAATQSLMLLNGPFVLGQAVHLEARIAREAKPLPGSPKVAGASVSADVIGGRIARAWELTLARPPSREELELASAFLQRQLSRHSKPGANELKQAMTNLCQSLLSCNEFLYVD